MGSLPHNIINTLVNAGYSNPIIDATEWGVPSTSNGSLGLSYTEQADLMTQGIARWKTWSLAGLSAISFTAGLVLDGIRKTRHEPSHLAYLRYAATTGPVSDG
jgi:hypothetical protein